MLVKPETEGIESKSKALSEVNHQMKKQSKLISKVQYVFPE